MTRRLGIVLTACCAWAVACSGSRGVPGAAAPATAAGACSVREEHAGNALIPFAMTFVFDAQGRLVEVSRTAADGTARRTRTLDASGRVANDVTVEKDASGKTIAERRHAITRDRTGRRTRSRLEEIRPDGAPPPETVEYAYDDHGRLLRAIAKNDKGETTHIDERAYGSDGTTSIVEGLPDREGGSVTHIQLRTGGQPPRITERVVEVNEPAPSTTAERFAYDAQGRLVRIEGKTTLERPPRSELGAVTFSYDDAGRCVASEKSYPDEPGTGVVETVKRAYAGACGEGVRRYFDPRAIYESEFDDDDD